jgi:chaperone modulatory protein CbpM
MTRPESRSSEKPLIEYVEVIEGDMLRAEEIARLCDKSYDWVMYRVEQDILSAQWRNGVCYFSSSTVWRARKIADLETRFDADPQLAALVADLAEEVSELRNRLKLLER